MFSMPFFKVMVEDRGDLVVGSFADYGAEVRLRQRNVGWKSVLPSLDGVDQIAVASAGDLPGRSVRDLLKLLDILRDHGVGLLLVSEGIEIGSSYDNGVLEIIRPLDRDAARARDGMRLTLVLMAVISASLLGLSILVLFVGARRRVTPPR